MITPNTVLPALIGLASCFLTLIAITLAREMWREARNAAGFDRWLDVAFSLFGGMLAGVAGVGALVMAYLTVASLISP